MTIIKKKAAKQRIFTNPLYHIPKITKLPWTFLATFLVLIVFGFLMLFSSSYVYGYAYHNGDSLFFVRSQFKYLLIGTGGFLVSVGIDYNRFRRWIPIGYFGCIVLLVAALLCEPINGCRRWITWSFLPFTIQPSEIVKTVMVFITAACMSFPKVSEFWQGVVCHFLLPGGLLVPLLVLLKMQPHHSCMIILVLIVATIITLDGRYLPLCLLCWCVGILGILLLLEEAKNGTGVLAERMNHFTSDVEAMSYQTKHSLFAIGSGGVFGVGLGNSLAKHLWLPEGYTDFVFSIICEELGLVGASMVIVLYVLFAFQGMLISFEAEDRFDRLLVAGFTAHITWQAWLNIAVATNTIPNTGIGLPFFSYGGTALIFCMIEMGFVTQIAAKQNWMNVSLTSERKVLIIG